MPFYLSYSPATKYSSIDYQKNHEAEYKKFLKSLQTTKNNSINLSEEKLFKNRQINLQYRENRRKIEYERIQKENLKFTQKLINAKTSLNRYEQQLFFDKHCQLKQRLQHYPDYTQNKTIKINKRNNLSFLI